jgi:hypothetical protein
MRPHRGTSRTRTGTTANDLPCPADTWGLCPQTPAPLSRRWALRAQTPVPAVRGWQNRFQAATMRFRRFGTGAPGEALPGFVDAASFAGRTAGTGTLKL